MLNCSAAMLSDWRFFFAVHSRLPFVYATIIIPVHSMAIVLWFGWAGRGGTKIHCSTATHPIHKFSRVPHHHQHNCIAYCWATRCSWLGFSSLLFFPALLFSLCRLCTRTFALLLATLAHDYLLLLPLLLLWMFRSVSFSELYANVKRNAMFLNDG